MPHEQMCFTKDNMHTLALSGNADQTFYSYVHVQES